MAAAAVSEGFDSPDLRGVLRARAYRSDVIEAGSVFGRAIVQADQTRYIAQKRSVQFGDQQYTVLVARTDAKYNGLLSINKVKFVLLALAIAILMIGLGFGLGFTGLGAALIVVITMTVLLPTTGIAGYLLGLHKDDAIDLSEARLYEKTPLEEAIEFLNKNNKAALLECAASSADLLEMAEKAYRKIDGVPDLTHDSFNKYSVALEKSIAEEREVYQRFRREVSIILPGENNPRIPTLRRDLDAKRLATQEARYAYIEGMCGMVKRCMPNLSRIVLITE